MKKIACTILIMILIIIQGCVKDNEKFVDIKPERIEFISDKSSIVADGEDKAQFSYKVYGKDNMELKDRMVVIYLNGEEYKDKLFLTSTPGAYIFSAKAGELKSSDLKIIATTQSATKIDLFLSKKEIADDNIDTVTISAIVYKDDKVLKAMNIDYYINGIKTNSNIFSTTNAGIYKVLAKFGDISSTEGAIEVIKKYKFMNLLIEKEITCDNDYNLYGQIVTQEKFDKIYGFTFGPDVSLYEKFDLGIGDLYYSKYLTYLDVYSLSIRDINFFRFNNLRELNMVKVQFPKEVFEKKNEVMTHIEKWSIINSYRYNINEDYFENMKYIKTLVWENSGLDNISFFKSFKDTKIENISLKNNNIQDINNMKYIAWLNNLDLSNNDIEDISAIPPHISNSIILDNNRIFDISRLKDLLMSSGSISLKGNKIKSLEPLREISSSSSSIIIEVNLENNMIEDITPLEEFKNVNTAILNLKNNYIKEISVLGKLDLTQLDISGNKISDISALKNCKRLQVLKASYTNISDLSVLADITNIEEIYLDGTKIEDLSALRSLKKLVGLNIRNTPKLDLSEGSQQLKIVKELEARGVIVGRD